MKSRLDQIETRLRAFIESSLYFLPGEHRQETLAHQLVAAIEQALPRETGGSLVSPNQFIIRLHPEHLSIWEARPGLIEALARVLNEAALSAGLELFSPPVIQFEPDPTLPLNRFEIQASARKTVVEETGVFLLQEEKSLVDPRPGQAFVILNGANTIPLRLAVINIGRRPDNQIVIDDPRVSRVHAQLRAVRGHYILFDLSSTGGTYINSIRITQQALKPGDVISLSGVALIYGEESIPAGSSQRNFETGRLELRQKPSSH